MRTSVALVLKDLSELESVEEKKALVKKEDVSGVIQKLVHYTYSPNVKWLLPEGDIPVNRESLPKTSSTNYLHAMIRKFKIFVDGQGYSHLRSNKREMIFVRHCRELSQDELDLLICVKDGDLSKYGLSLEVAKEIWPDADFASVVEMEEKLELPVVEPEPKSDSEMLKESLKEEPEEKPKKKAPAKKKKAPAKKKKAPAKKKKSTKKEDK